MTGSDSKADAKVAVFRARQLLKEKRYADALQVCTDELARGRDDPQLRLIAAHSLMAQGRHEGAKKEAQLVIRLDPRQPEAFRILADVACTRGELQTACEHLEQVLKLDPDDEKSKSLLETLARPPGQDAPGEAGEPTPHTRPITRAEQEDLKSTSADRFVEESAPAVELSEDDLIEEADEVEEIRDEEPIGIGPDTGERLFPPVDGADQPHVDPFSGEIFSVTDSMMEEMPEKSDPSLQIDSKDEPPPPGLRTEHDLPLTEKDDQVEIKKHEDTGTVEAVKAGWGGTPGAPGAPPKDAGAGSAQKYQATLRLPSLDELPDDEDAPTMPLLRPSAPPAPQLKLDPMASKPVSHEKVSERKPSPASGPAPTLEPIVESPKQQMTKALPGIDSSSPLDGDGAFEDFAVEPASVPLQRPDPKPIPRETLDPIKAQQAMTGGPPGAPDPLAMMTGAVDDFPEQRQPSPSGQHPPIAAVPSEVSGNMIGMLAGGDGDMRHSDPSFPTLPAEMGEMPMAPDAPAPEDDLERQLMAAGLSEPHKEKGHGLRWFLVALLGLLLGGGGLGGYLWYRTYKFIKGEFATFRTNVHRSTPDGFRQARKAAERILERKEKNLKAKAALAMCDAAMSIEFGDDRLKAAKEALEATKGTDSEWRTAANAFMALVDDPDRAAGYLQKGLEVYPDSALLHYLKGRALAAGGDPERAGESFQAALKRAPKFVAAKTTLANLVGLNADRLTEAVGMLDEVISKDAGNVQALIERARLRARHGKDLELAADDARRVTSELSEKAGKGQVGWGYLVLAQVARLKGQFNQVGSSLEQAAQSPPCCDSSFAYELAGEMILAFRLADAQAQMVRALELKPKKAEYLQRMARVLLELDDPAGAAVYLKSAPARLLETRLLQGRLLYARRYHSKAVEHLKRVLNEQPKLVEASLYVALANAGRRKNDEAIRQLQKLASAHPTDHRIYKALATVRLKKGDFDSCHAALKKAWKITKLDPETPTLAGRMYLRKHDLATAGKRFARALQARSDYRPAHLGLARIYVLTGDIATARAELKKIPEEQKKRYDVFAMTTSIELAAGNTDAARSAVAQAEAAGAPKSLVARLAGEVALAQKKGAEALGLLQTALKKMGRSAELLTLLAKAQAAAGKVDDSYDSYHQALRSDGGYPEALLGLSRIAIRDGEFFIAIKRINDALKKIAERGRPQTMKAQAHTVLGLAHLKKGDTGRSITNLQDAIDLDPNLAEPNYLMGKTYDKLDRPKRAIAYYDKAIKLDASLTDAYYRLGKAYAKSGDGQNALRYYQDYLNRNPPHARAQAVARAIKQLQGE